MDVRSDLALVTQAAGGPRPTLSGAPERSSMAGVVAKLLGTEELLAVEAGRLLEDIRTALPCDLSAATQAASSLAALLATTRPQSARVGPARGGLAPWQKHKIQNYIEKHLDGSLLVDDLAKLVSLSTSYFCRAFKESVGESPHAYIIRMRTERARALMLSTSDGLSDIALACGLVDQSHLCRCFRQVTGTTPAAWRRRHAIAFSRG